MQGKAFLFNAIPDLIIIKKNFLQKHPEEAEFLDQISFNNRRWGFFCDWNIPPGDGNNTFPELSTFIIYPGPWKPWTLKPFPVEWM